MNSLKILYQFFFTIILLSFIDVRANTFNQLYTFTYIFNNPSLGPIAGVEKVKVLMKNRKIVSIWSLKTGLEIKNNHILDKLLTVMNGNTHNLEIEYDDNNFPKKIKPILDKTKDGGWYMIEIENFKFINDFSYAIDIKQERQIEFNTNYQKWKSFNIKDYTYSYQNSQERTLYVDGVKVTVENGKIVKAMDIRSFQYIGAGEIKSFINIEDLFFIAKINLEKNMKIDILYERKYGYPYLLIIHNDSEKEHIIFSQKLRL